MIVFFSRRAGYPLLAGSLLLLSLGSAGCGAAVGELSGKVSYQGKPVVYGSVLLVGTDAKPRTSRIEPDSSYHFADVPVGEAKLVVYSPDPAKEAEARKKAEKLMEEELRKSSPESPLPLKPAAPALPAVDRTKWFAIPAEYSDVNRSGLHVTIHRGPNTYPIEMK